MKVPETMEYQIEQDPATGKWAVFEIDTGDKVSDDFETRFDAMKDMKQRMADESLNKKDESKDSKEKPKKGAGDQAEQE